MSCNILACVKSNIGERDNAYTRSSLINHRYSPDEFLFHNPAALFERHVRCNGHDRFAHAIRGSQIERIEIVGYSAANNIPIGYDADRKSAHCIFDHRNFSAILDSH
jgi:hypothetical protein